MNTGRLYEFLVLSKLLSYSKAASALYISQSVLTKHIQELEKEAGLPLFHRTTHGVTLTEAGRVLAKEAPELINKCESALRRFKRKCSRDGIIGDLRKKEFYEKPSVRRKKKSEAARKRSRN